MKLFLRSLFDQDWLTKAKMIRCLAPLPEGLENPVLEKMLEVAPCPEPLKEDTGGGDNTGGRGPPSLPVPTEGMSVSTKEDNRGRKRTASEDSEAEASKWEKKSPIEGPALGVFLLHKVRGGISPPTSRK